LYEVIGPLPVLMKRRSMNLGSPTGTCLASLLRPLAAGSFWNPQGSPSLGQHVGVSAPKRR